MSSNDAAPVIALASTQKSDRKTMLLEAAMDVFVDKGYHQASMDDIAARAGVTKPVVYQHFDGKRELYLGLLDDSVEQVVAGISQAIARESFNVKRLEAAVGFYFAAVDDADKSYRLIFESDFTQDADVSARLDDLISQLARIVGREIANETGLTSGEANILAAGLCGMAQAAAWRWIRLGRPVSREKAISGITYLGWEGLRTFPS